MVFQHRQPGECVDSEEADVRLEADGREWGQVVGWGEVPEQQLGDLTELFDDASAEEQDWQERALCAQTDPEAFFPEKGGSTREAKRICLGCEVKDECLEYALAHDERFGIWGGLSERERRKLKKRAV
ncbi:MULTISPECIES: WhiB family transcriptional regulator [Amycolatopsis]|uniref:Transcriptional regulator WhiB n=6 Tax=Amycolatopsis TaxID=1813 RepID=R4TFA8_9PSEU|nr:MULTISPECIES: WhiB family transcriptional regulator [Amycolatopsis]AGM09412.1 WhiB family transcriptional regulator [Amycolatopsis keratiniphila]EME63961.1 WhiB family transcriptional regulator [Amycolatopsis decaplanina DSM 44594]SEE08749.1 transcription factor WhiB [Amycolatopsis lurida]SFI12138.1 transcription factor WhiB [Amycolatopsis regifaucium]HET6289257.1 WhiB family transcriptional regulator [Amycolatopsis sp.]